MAVVYRHIRLDTNEPFYIGIGKDEKRAYSKNNRNVHWHNIVNKTEYRVDILFDDLTIEQAKEKEREFIALYGRRDLGTGTLVNQTDGGEGTMNFSEEIINKRRAYLIGRKLSQSTRNKISNSLTGRKLSDETKMKISKKSKGRKRSEEHKRKISESHKGKLPVNSISITIEGKDFYSIRAAARYYKIGRRSLNKQIKKIN